MSLASHTIEDLVSLCRRRDQRAQFEVYNRYCRAMYNVALRIVKDEHYAEDVMQEGFLKAFTKIDDYRQEVAFGAWLKKIIVNYSIDFYKKNSRFVQEDLEKTLYKLEDGDFKESEMDFIHLKANQVFESIQGLKDSYRMVLTLFFIEGYDHEEITDILGINYGNCRTLLSRAKESLRNKLQEL
ncbi:RNA polymerase sigma factor [Flavobacterium selenitireducens]|uniref:RNA polymerase sigma factor n=1 Tax=Flavobacterium selenitireducens TaxID=2722704 RepID=UPI00168B70FE|nr:RNA polymerase sigma factor [Flavobacterium selenitireducens]MBD3580888.1 RNA polymerase sigma factor [Flavobacterium selenitireducens]